MYIIIGLIQLCQETYGYTESFFFVVMLLYVTVDDKVAASEAGDAKVPLPDTWSLLVFKKVGDCLLWYIIFASQWRSINSFVFYVSVYLANRWCLLHLTTGPVLFETSIYSHVETSLS